MLTSFSRNEIDAIFYNINTERLPGGDEIPKDCGCNLGSLVSCGAGTSCKGSNCAADTTGCGFAWLWECNGICELTQF